MHKVNGTTTGGGSISCPESIVQPENTFEQLVLGIKSVLTKSPGFDFSDIDPEPLSLLLENYKSNREDWSKYAHENKDQCFTRNLVDRGSGKHNLVSQAKRSGRCDLAHRSS